MQFWLCLVDISFFFKVRDIQILDLGLGLGLGLVLGCWLGLGVKS